jgi:hypothetical protein
MHVAILPALAMLSVSPLAQQPAPKHDSEPSRAVLTTVDGCVSGFAFKATSLVETDASGQIEYGRTFELTGSKTIKAQIKKLSGWMVRVNGELQNPQATAPKGKKMGKATVYIAQQGSEPRPDLSSTQGVPPTITVHAIERLEDRCSGQ